MSENQVPGYDPQSQPSRTGQGQPANPPYPPYGTPVNQGPNVPAGSQPVHQAAGYQQQPTQQGQYRSSTAPFQSQDPRMAQQPTSQYSTASAQHAQPTTQQPPVQPGAAPGARQQATAPAPKAKAKRDRSSLKTFALGFLGALLACVLALGVFSLNSPSTSTVTIVGGNGGTPITVSGTDITLPEVVAQKTLPSIVSIDTFARQSSPFMRGSGDLVPYGSGSGVILSEDGYILTNYHVIENADKIVVSAGTTEYEADVTGADQSSDLAVLKIDASELTPIEIGSSSDLVVGEWCMAVGSAFGLGESVSQGIVSATNRTSAELNDETGSAVYANMIQTDAAVNPGNSGGALVDSEGKLIGITTMGATYSGDNSGVNFAIPSDYAIEIAQQIIDGKTPSHAQLGVTMATVSSENAGSYDLPVASGAYVNDVASGSAADKAGIEQGDILVKIDDTEITSALDAILAIRSHKVGDKITVTVNRGGTEMTMDATLGSDN